MTAEYYTSMNFTVRADDIEVACRSVQGIAGEQEQEYIREGGLNNYVHVRPKSVSRTQTLRLLCNASKNTEAVFKVGGRLKQGLVVELRPEPRRMVRFTFTGCLVTERKFSDLYADKSQLLEETVGITYEEMKVEYGEG